jgi:hypothetical protein
MADPFQDILDAVSQVLRQRSQVYVGAQHEELSALGSQLASASSGNPVIARELGFVAALMALDPETFYEAAILRVTRLSGLVRNLSTLVSTVFEGPNGLLRWSSSSLGIRSEVDLARMEALRDQVRRGRFARSEVTDEVHADLLGKARLAADELARMLLLPEVLSATLPSPASLNNFRDDLYELENSIDQLLGISDAWSEVDWRDFSLRRMLESFDVDLTADITAIRELGAADGPLDQALAHTVLAIEIMERLLSTPEPFGELLAPDVSVAAKPDLKTRDIRLRPVPELVKGRRSWPAKVTVASTTSHTFETCIRSDAAWDHPTWYEQDLTLTPSRQSAGWIDAATLAPLNPLIMETSSALMLLNTDGSLPPTWTAQHALYDWILLNGWSQLAAWADKVYIDEPAAADMPVVGDYVRYGDAGGYRFEITSVASSASNLNNVPGVYRLIKIADSEGDLFNDTPSQTVAAFLIAKAAAYSAPAPLAKLDTFAGLDFAGFQLSSLGISSPGSAGVRLHWSINPPADAYYGSPFNAEQDAAVWYLGIANHDSHVILTTPWPSSDPYGDRNWTATAFLYKDKSTTSVTNTFKLDVSWSLDLKTKIVNEFLQRSLRLVDQAGVQTPIDVRATACYVRTTDLVSPQNAAFMQTDDLVIVLDQEVSSTVTWVLQIQTGVFQQAGYYSSFEVGAVTPYRGFTNLAPNISPGDGLYLQDGQTCLVWATNGNRALVVPPVASGPVEVNNAYRIRHLRSGDRFVYMNDTAGAAAVWKITGISYNSIVAKPLSDVSKALTNGVYNYTPVVATADTATSRRFEVLEESSNALIDLDALERLFRVQLSQELTIGEGSITPIRWYLRAGGRLHSASMMGDGVVLTGSLSRPLPSAPVPAQFVVRVKGDGYDGTLNVREVWKSEEGVALGEYPAGNSQIYDLIKSVRIQVSALTLPAAASTVDVRTITQLYGAVRGPLTSGGTPSWPPWALMEYRLQRRSKLDLEELFADIGRARSTVGLPLTPVAGQAGLTLVLDSSRRSGTLTVVDPAGSIDAPLAIRVEGCDVVFLTGAKADPPVRIRDATSDESNPLIMAVTFSLQVPPTLSGTVTLYESALSSAWREVRVLMTYLENLTTYLSYPRIPSRNRIVTSAARLKASGFPKAAQSLIDADFDKWVDPDWNSEDAHGLMDRVTDMMTSLSRRRPAPIEGGQ